MVFPCIYLQCGYFIQENCNNQVQIGRGKASLCMFMYTVKKILSIEALAKVISKLKKGGKRIVLCHGVFDLLHIGHIKHFQKAKNLGDILIVTLTPDKFVNKGPNKPAFREELRLEALAALDVVDFLSLNNTPTAISVIQKLKPVNP